MIATTQQSLEEKYKEIASQVHWKTVLQRLGLDPKTKGDHLIVNCPQCEKPECSFYPNLSKGDPEESQAKADLSRQIRQVIQNRKLTQMEAAEVMGIDQPKVSDIIRGKLSKYTIDRLIRFLRLLGRDIEIRVKRHSKHSKPTSLQVFGVEPNRFSKISSCIRFVVKVMPIACLN